MAPDSKKEIRPGQRFSWERTVTQEDILRFAEISGDRGRHHVQPDEKGRLLAQGLLTATLPTKLGGDLDFVARTMTFEFLRPVYSGDALRCEGTVDAVERRSKRLKLELSFQVTNQEGRVVMKGTTTGNIFLAAES